MSRKITIFKFVYSSHLIFRKLLSHVINPTKDTFLLFATMIWDKTVSKNQFFIWFFSRWKFLEYFAMGTDLSTVHVCVTKIVQHGLKPAFHYPSSRPEFTGRVDGPSTRVQFLTPVNSARVHGCQKMHPSSRAVNSARELG